MATNASATATPATPDERFDYRFGAPTPRFRLPDGDPGIARTVQWMNGLVRGREGATHPLVRQNAVCIVHGIDSHDKPAQMAAVLEWVKKNVDFRGEYKELLQTPVVTLQLGAGDCDDHSMLIAALLKSLGFTTRFNTVAADAEDPTQFSHVFCEVFDPTTQEWTALDSTVSGSYPGWRPTKVYRQKSWPTLGDPSDDLANDIVGLAMPLDQALAYKIQGTTPLVADLNFGNLFSPGSATPTILGMPWWGALLVLGGVVWLVNRR
jgi:Transglutaminase-like superfamily